MTSTELYEHPTLNSVHFEIRYTPRFFLGQRIGDIQLKITDLFPIASQIIQQDLMMSGDGIPLSQENILIWRFENATKKTRVDIRNDRLIISSFEYKSFDYPGEQQFKPIIEKMINGFLQVIPIIDFNRIGFRYIDHCPLEQKTNEYFKKYYNPLFCVDRYSLEEINEYAQVIRVKRDTKFLALRTGIQKINNEDKYIMDFDAYMENVPANNYLHITEELHELIKNEYNANITEALKVWMKKK